MQVSAPRQTAAFTLTELLTVIAIIGILAAILIPTVAKIRQTANRTQSVANLKAIGSAILLYAQDNKSQLPVARTGLQMWWPVSLWPYLQDPAVLTRPGVDLVNGPGRNNPAVSAHTQAPSGELIVFCYAINGGGGWVPFPEFYVTPVRLSQVVNPSRTIAMGEMSDQSALPWINVATGNTTMDRSRLEQRLRFDGGKATLLFLDGHVGQMTAEQIQVENIFYTMN